MINKTLRTHVMCCGLPYGKGESNEIFYDFFRRAWLSMHKKLATLNVIDKGKNIVPTLHVTDLAKFARQIIVNRYKQQYFVVTDYSKQRLKDIIGSISKGIGIGKTKKKEMNQLLEEEWSEFLSLNLNIEPSMIFSEYNSWHCREGIRLSSIPMLLQEFNLYRGLFPLKVLVAGPPASGKSHFALLLSQKYGVPLIKIEDLVALGDDLEDDLGDKIKTYIEEQKNIVVAAYDKTKKKKDPELDRNSIKIRLPDDFLSKLLQRKL